MKEGKKIKVNMKPKQETEREDNFFIGSLPGGVEEHELKEYLSFFGNIRNLELICNKKTKYCRGYGFVSIDLRIPESTFLHMPHMFKERQIYFRPHMVGDKLHGRKEEFMSKRLFITGVPPFATAEDLKDTFKEYGVISLAYVAPNHTSKDDRNFFGFVNFEDMNSVQRILSEATHLVCGCAVKCAPFNPKRYHNPKTEEISGAPKNMLQPNDKSNTGQEFGSWQTDKLKDELRFNKRDEPTFISQVKTLQLQNKKYSGMYRAKNSEFKFTAGFGQDLKRFADHLAESHNRVNIRLNLKF